ncbi:Histidyl-tRNA synthetase [hydrothermal vent metagenome]|uniref:histidine--tRNA ligase n=1 Tax=hydrothermal vent metagenome TaxID=652676 RepID=A0A3B0YJ61_9ZZZZ
MSKIIRKVKGMRQILPDVTPAWQYIEQKISDLCRQYGYSEIRLPILEKTELFKRSIGEVTDIVEKEMYTFKDITDDSLTLRPEGTAGCVRAALEEGLLYNQQQRFWYSGYMFRRENPQANRYRQFQQIGIEAFGFAGVDIELEHLALTSRLWKKLGLRNVSLEINTLGTLEERGRYRELLVNYLTSHEDKLDKDSIRRLKSNPLRILDSKNPAMQDLIESAPKLYDSLDNESKEKFERLKLLLDELQIDYSVNPRLVRGLDYYSHTVYEWVSKELGAQGTICAGGRFDDLVEQLGGKANYAAGFALGVDRVLNLMTAQNLIPDKPVTHVYLAMLGDDVERHGWKLAESLREQCPELALTVNIGGGKFQKQIKKADKSGALLAFILGEDEVQNQQITIKYLREDGKQLKIAQADIVKFLQDFMAND